MASRLIVCSLALLVTSASACGGDVDTSAAALRPGAVLVHEGRRLVSYSAATPTVAFLRVQEVGHDAGRWVVTVRMKFQDVPTSSPAPVGCSGCGDRDGAGVGSLSFPLVTSVDGLRWAPLEPAGAWTDGYLLGVHPYAPGDRAWAVGEVSFPGAGGEVYTAWRAKGVDIAGAAFESGAHDGVDLPGQPRPTGATLSGVWPVEGLGDALTAFVLRDDLGASGCAEGRCVIP